MDDNPTEDTKEEFEFTPIEGLSQMLLDYESAQGQRGVTAEVEPCPSQEVQFSQIEGLTQMISEAQTDHGQSDATEKVEPCPSQEFEFSQIDDLSQKIFDAELNQAVEYIVTEVLQAEEVLTENVEYVSESVERMSSRHTSDEFDSEFDEAVSGMTFKTIDSDENMDSFGSDGTFERIVSEIPIEQLIPPSDKTAPRQNNKESQSTDSSELMSLSGIIDEINKD